MTEELRKRLNEFCDIQDNTELPLSADDVRAIVAALRLEYSRGFGEGWDIAYHDHRPTPKPLTREYVAATRGVWWDRSSMEYRCVTCGWKVSEMQECGCGKL